MNIQQYTWLRYVYVQIEKGKFQQQKKEWMNRK